MLVVKGLQGIVRILFPAPATLRVLQKAHAERSARCEASQTSVKFSQGSRFGVMVWGIIPMTYADYLVRNRHKSRWFVRITVPKHLRQEIGKREIRHTTGTCDKKEARSVAMTIFLMYEIFFKELTMARKDKGFIRTSQAQGRDAFNRLLEFNFDGPDAHEKELEALLIAQEASQQQLTKMIEKFADRPELVDKLLRYRVHEEAASVQTPVVDNPQSFGEVCVKYKLSRRGKISERSQKDELIRIDFWNAVFADREMHELSRSDINSAKEWLEYIPPASRSQTPTELEAEAKNRMTIGLVRAKAQTYNKWATALRGLLKYAYSSGAHHDDLSNFIPTLDAKSSVGTEKAVFSAEDLKSMFPGDQYGQNFGRANAKMVTMEAKFWLPLILLFTGCRVEEIAQLRPADVLLDPNTNIWYLRISSREAKPDGGAQRVKNSSSNRPVPLHKTLIDIGLITYVASIDNRMGSLFKLHAASGLYGKEFSKYFTRKSSSGSKSKGYIERCGIMTREIKADGTMISKSVHSFRHTVATQLAQTYGSGQSFGYVLGHTEQGETTRYIADSSVNRLGKRNEIIQTLRFEEVNFEEISWGKFEGKFLNHS